MSRVLVIACGNPLRSDDGAGWRVMEALHAETSERGIGEEDMVRRETVQQLTPELAEEVSQAETVIFVDATEAAEAGSVTVKPVRELQEAKRALTHFLAPEALLFLARQLYGRAPQQAFVVAVGGESFGFSEELSEPVARSVKQAVEAVRALASDDAVAGRDAESSVAHGG